MYAKILVPLDGSSRAEAILPHVQELASLYGSEVILLRVFEIPHMVGRTNVPDDEYLALPQISREDLVAHVSAAQQYLNGACQRLGEGSQFIARGRVAYGPIAATIIRIAEEENADLIAMASHGSSGIKGVYYGSVAAGVLQRVDRPLLIVRAYDSD